MSTPDERRLRGKLFRMQGGFCHYCGRQMIQNVPPGQKGHLSDRTVTLEHLKPRSQGGKSNRTNCVAVCRACNMARGHMPMEEWDAFLSAAQEMRCD